MERWVMRSGTPGPLLAPGVFSYAVSNNYYNRLSSDKVFHCLALFLELLFRRRHFTATEIVDI